MTFFNLLITLQCFRSYQGKIMDVPVSVLMSSQPDDHIPSAGYGAIEACHDTGNILITKS